MALREVIAKAGPVLFESAMKVEIISPEECLKSIVGGINSRSGQNIRTTLRDNAQVVTAIMPLANMFGY